MRRVYFVFIVEPIAKYLSVKSQSVHWFFKQYFLRELGFQTTKDLNALSWVEYMNSIRDWWWWDIHGGDVDFILELPWEL